MEDLEQVATLALLEAIDRLDPARPETFSSFAAMTVVGELKRHFRDNSWTFGFRAGSRILRCGSDDR